MTKCFFPKMFLISFCCETKKIQVKVPEFYTKECHIDSELDNTLHYKRICYKTSMHSILPVVSIVYGVVSGHL